MLANVRFPQTSDFSHQGEQVTLCPGATACSQRWSQTQEEKRKMPFRCSIFPLASTPLRQKKSPRPLKFGFCQAINLSQQCALYLQVPFWGPLFALARVRIVFYYYSSRAASVVNPLTIQSERWLLWIIKSSQPLAPRPG